MGTTRRTRPGSRAGSPYEGSAVLSNALGRPELMADQARRLGEWIETLQL